MVRIGVDLGGSKIEAALLAAGGRLTARRRRPTPQDDYPATLATIATLVGELEVEHGASCSVGVGHPGARSAIDGRIKNANSTCLIGHDLCGDLQQVLSREVRLANDADCFALSEAADGAAAGASPVFGVILGTGVGGGVVVDGHLLHGANAIAGEWGHNPLPDRLDDERPGRLCYCGRLGCIETFLSGPGLVADAGCQADDGARQVIQQALAGDAAAGAAVDRYFHRLARALAGVINIIDPEVIVLGGGLSHFSQLYERVPQLWTPYVFSDQVVTRLVPPVHGDASGVRGAARLWPL